MQPLYAARIQHLGPGDFVKVECMACGHVELLSPDKLRIKGLPLPPYTPGGRVDGLRLRRSLTHEPARTTPGACILLGLRT
jgi:hypothetical protein